MSSDSEVGSPVRRFIDSFFQEQNIKWILALGMLILLGSSLMFVTSHWHESTPVGNSLILLAYMAAVFAAGEVSYWRLGLRKTGTVLMSLTVLLLPISFLALRWVR